MLSPEQVKVLLDYDPASGKLYWKPRPEHLFSGNAPMRRWNTRFSGKEAMTANHIKGYKCGNINSKLHLAHRVAWVLYYGCWPNHIDHINGDKKDNRIENLRSVTNAENHRNMPLRKDNKSGFQNVMLEKRSGKWVARARIGGKDFYIGVFPTAELAGKARKDFDKGGAFHPNHGAR